uniref:Uncharacterized protein n=1 Tax=Athene cunicularia TaxID=194338 RepID=A0A663M869_ATHCN
MALNRIQLHCSHGRDPGVGFTAEPQSEPPLWLPPPPAPPGLCTNSVSPPSSWGHQSEGPGSTWSQWGSWSPHCPRAVCGIQMQQDPAQGLKRDNMALNDLCLLCCP